MFEREHHRRIAKILNAFDSEILQEAECYFSGGTAIAMALDEYRESVDIDFLCASKDGYRLLRNAVAGDLGKLMREPVRHLREVRTDQYKIYTVIEVDGTPVKVELVRESRVSIQGSLDPSLNVPVLSRDGLFCQKLLANADRGLDRSVLSRDIIDLAMMLKGWGDIPQRAWQMAHDAYGDLLSRAFHQSVGLVSDPAYLAGCLRKMQMDPSLADEIPAILEGAGGKLPLNTEDALERDRRILNVRALKKMGAVPHVFWRFADEAMKSTASPCDVDWAAVERKTIRECICERKQPPEPVAEVIAQYSPGAVPFERQAVIRNNIECLADKIQALYGEMDEGEGHGLML